MKVSACIEMLFRDEADFYRRIKLAKQSGASYIEFWGWTSKDMQRIKQLSDECGISVSGFSLSSGDGEKDKARAAQPLVDDLGDELIVYAAQKSLEQAQVLGAKRLILTVGEAPRGEWDGQKRHNMVRKLTKAADVLKGTGVKLVIEPLNLYDHPGYFLTRSAEAAEIVRLVGREEIAMLFDVYHQQISEGNLIQNIRNFKDAIGYYHIADVPGRNQPGTGEINYKNVFSAIAETGYDGPLGLEYVAKGDSAQSVRDTIALLS